MGWIRRVVEGRELLVHEAAEALPVVLDEIGGVEVREVRGARGLRSWPKRVELERVEPEVAGARGLQWR